MSTLLDKRTVVVSGAGAGIGLAILRAAAANGARVFGIDRSDAAADLIYDAGGTFLQADVRDTSAFTEAINRARRDSGRLDGMVCNAGLTLTVPFLDATVETWDRLWQTNQRSVLVGCQAAARIMIEDGSPGSLVNVASVHASASAQDYEAYAGTKAAIVAMGRSMAWSLGEHGVRVNTLSPGLTLTENVAHLAQDAELAAVFRSWQATGRISSVDEISAVALFLLSDSSVALTGAEIVADQGTAARLYNFDHRRSHD